MTQGFGETCCLQLQKLKRTTFWFPYKTRNFLVSWRIIGGSRIDPPYSVVNKSRSEKMQTQTKKELIYYLKQGSRATNWEVSPYSAVRKTIQLFPPHPYNVPPSWIATLFIPTFQRSILSFYPPINSLFVLSAFCCVMLSKANKTHDVRPLLHSRGPSGNMVEDR